PTLRAWSASLPSPGTPPASSPTTSWSTRPTGRPRPRACKACAGWWASWPRSPPRAKRRRLARPQRKPEADLRFRVTVQAGPASGVAGVADEVRWVDADLVEGTLVLLIEVAVEQQVEVGWAVQPAVGLDLV